MMPGNAIKRHVIVEQRLKRWQKMHVTLILIKLNIMIQKIGVITSGIPYQYVKEALT